MVVAPWDRKRGEEFGDCWVGRKVAVWERGRDVGVSLFFILDKRG